MCVCKFMEKNKKGHQKTDDSRVVKRALRKTRATVASLQGEELKDKLNCKDTTMEGIEAIQELGRVMADSINRGRIKSCYSRVQHFWTEDGLWKKCMVHQVGPNYYLVRLGAH